MNLFRNIEWLKEDKKRYNIGLISSDHSYQLFSTFLYIHNGLGDERLYEFIDNNYPEFVKNLTICWFTASSLHFAFFYLVLGRHLDSSVIHFKSLYFFGVTDFYLLFYHYTLGLVLSLTPYINFFDPDTFSWSDCTLHSSVCWMIGNFFIPDKWCNQIDSLFHVEGAGFVLD